MRKATAWPRKINGVKFVLMLKFWDGYREQREWEVCREASSRMQERKDQGHLKIKEGCTGGKTGNVCVALC